METIKFEVIDSDKARINKPEGYIILNLEHDNYDIKIEFTTDKWQEPEPADINAFHYLHGTGYQGSAGYPENIIMTKATIIRDDNEEEITDTELLNELQKTIDGDERLCDDLYEPDEYEEYEPEWDYD